MHTSHHLSIYTHLTPAHISHTLPLLSLKCARILASALEASSSPNICCVVSAMGGKPKTTDLLLNLVAFASVRDEKVRARESRFRLEKFRHRTPNLTPLPTLPQGIDETVQIIVDKHTKCISTLSIPESERESLLGLITRDIKDIRDVLKTVSLMKWKPSKIQSLVSGYGEVWSANILTAVMRGTYPDGPYIYRYLDARLVLVVDETVEDEQTIVWTDR